MNLDETLLPPISLDLLTALESHFPEQSAQLSWGDREVWFKSGQRSVVRFLQKHYQIQQENMLGHQ